MLKTLCLCFIQGIFACNCYKKSVSELSGLSCNKSDIPVNQAWYKLSTSYSDLLKSWDKQCKYNLLMAC